MERLALYNNKYSWPDRLKSLGKKFLNLPPGGPEGVFVNLSQGLKQIGADFVVNKNFSSRYPVVGVLSGVLVLESALEAKSTGKIRKIIAGPNIVVSPTDNGNILTSPLIDKIIVPSQWVKDFYVLLCPSLVNKIFIWPSGVNLPEISTYPKTIDFLIYNKLSNKSILGSIIEILKKNNFKVQILEYGKHKQSSYFKLLNQTRYLVYLSQSESQGLAMFEAWARGVPSLVFEPGIFTRDNLEVKGKVGAPYLSPESGMSFTDSADFEKVLTKFLSTSFFARNYIEKNYSLAFAAKKYLEIIEQ